MYFDWNFTDLFPRIQLIWTIDGFLVLIDAYMRHSVAMIESSTP